MKSARHYFILLILAALAAWLRLSYYEPFNRSVSNYDTDRYMISSESPIFSLEFYTSIRQPSVAMAYQFVEPQSGYKLTNLSSPGDDVHPALEIQPGFDRVTALQSWLSIFSWLFLAWVVFRNIRNPNLGFLGATLILLFGFAPQMAEWDYVMLSEPISLSLFVILLGLSIELVVTLLGEQQRLSWKPIFLAVIWLLVAILWLLARDTNSYLLLPIIAVILLLAWRRTASRKLSLGYLVGAGLLLLSLFLVAARLSQASDRWVNPYFNNLLARVLPVPEYRAYFVERGLPVTEALMAEVGGNLTELSLFQMPNLVSWVEEEGLSTYFGFMLTHPGWAIGTFSDGVAIAFTENVQPFFRRNTDVTPEFLVFLGGLLHPKDETIILIVALELLLLGRLAAKTGLPGLIALSFLFSVFFLGELLMFFVSVHGDAAGIVRHSMGSVMPLRLSLWLSIPFIFDAMEIVPS